MLLTVCRAGQVLDLFHRQSEWGVTALASELGIAKSQSHELLDSLCFIGLVRRSGRGRYRLGWGTVSLSHELLRHEFRGRGLRSVQRVAEATRQTVHLVTLDRSRIVVLAARQGLEDCPPDGLKEEPLHCTAAGQLLIAMHDEAEAYVAGQHLLEIRQRGLATDLGEFHPERRAVAVPVRDVDGQALAALTLTTTPDRWQSRERTYKTVVEREATAISRGIRHLAGADAQRAAA
jgi:DNA-binding IclR family transcriptional regulator